jgi:hypothetical protein
MRDPETCAVTMLVEILAEHTMRTLESLRFLFGKMEGGPNKRPSFIVDQISKISILHVLAGSELFTEIAQITPSILNLCLGEFLHQLQGPESRNTTLICYRQLKQSYS